jgi:hypothetical protein
MYGKVGRSSKSVPETSDLLHLVIFRYTYKTKTAKTIEDRMKKKAVLAA